MLIGGCHPRLNFTVFKKRFKLVAQSFEIFGSFATRTLGDMFQECLKVINPLTTFMIINNFLQLPEHLFEFTSDVTIEPRIFSHLPPNPLHQRPKSLWHLTGAHALPKSLNHLSNILLICITTQHRNPTKPLEEADDKIQHGVADLMLCHVSGQNTAAGDFTAGIIPNELLKPLGQLGNEAATGIQSLLNLLKRLLIGFRHRPLNILKKLRNSLGQPSSTITAIAPILPRHPQDPVDGLLQVGRASRERATGADKGAFNSNMRTL
ncbi:eukaryotic translation initiation factor 3 subunit C-like protein [Babesia caballi]|uniref:Eukaryotic translation initiation factor 3 subunit C-like protein n=1 Tax=Babesia caballi TaxID=5871 RepID=A0AAV4LU56_BABCB|nr:eukaryotic translation initiation factor 3 subunit C-like protein [Babesia caballi]